MLLPAAASPPPGFGTMSQAYIDALNSVWGGLPLLCVLMFLSCLLLPEAQTLFSLLHAHARTYDAF